MAFFATEQLMGLDPPFEGYRAQVLRRGGEIAWLRWTDVRLHRRVR